MDIVEYFDEEGKDFVGEEDMQKIVNGGDVNKGEQKIQVNFLSVCLVGIRIQLNFC